MKQENENTNELSIELTEEVAGGLYSNFAVITHSSSEFILDFIQVMPGFPKAKVKSRIILAPEHAKRLLGALEENIANFESIHGKINTSEEPPFPMNFGGPAAEA